MKKFLKYSILSLSLLATPLMFSCSDDDDDDIFKQETISYDKLPSAAQSFVETYYPDSKITRVEKDFDDGVVLYEITFSDGQEVTFSSTGEWVEVDAPDGKSIPEGIIPDAIRSYLDTNYSGYGVNDITKTKNGYEVELVTGLDLRFDSLGNFVGIDR